MHAAMMKHVNVSCGHIMSMPVTHIAQVSLNDHVLFPHSGQPVIHVVVFLHLQLIHVVMARNSRCAPNPVTQVVGRRNSGC